MIGPSAAEICIKYIGIVMTAYFIMLNSVKETESQRKKTAGFAAVGITGTAIGLIDFFWPFLSVVLMLILFCLAMWGIFRFGFKRIVTFTMVSFGISYFFYIAALGFTVFMLYLNKVAVSDRFDRSVDAWIYVVHYVTSFKGGIINRSFMFFVQFSLLLITLRFRKAENLINGLMTAESNDTVIYLWIAALSMRTLTMTSVFTRNDIMSVCIICVFLVILFFSVLFFWIKKEIRSTYTVRLQENELSMLDKSLAEKDKIINKLRSDNERLAEIIHRDNKLIPSIVMSVRKAAERAGADGDDFHSRETAAALGEISAERVAVLSEYEEHRRRIIKSGVMAVDSVLLIMAEMAFSCGVGFSVNITGDLCKMLENTVERCEFIAVLTHLCEYAVSSAKDTENSAVDVSIGQHAGNLFIEVADSGGTFYIDALKCIGKKQRSANAGEAGEGTVGVPLMSILRHTGANLTIDECPSGEKFTKSLRVTFIRRKDGDE